MKTSLTLIIVFVFGAAQTSVAQKRQPRSEEKRFVAPSPGKSANSATRLGGRKTSASSHEYHSFMAAASLVGLATTAWFSAVYFSLEGDDGARMDELYHRFLNVIGTTPDDAPFSRDDFYGMVLPVLGMTSGAAAGAAMGVVADGVGANEAQKMKLLFILMVSFFKFLH